MNDLGQIVYDEFFKSFEIRKELFLGGFVLMPNHLHAIVILDKTDCEYSTDGLAETNGHNVETYGRYVDARPCVFTMRWPTWRIANPAIVAQAKINIVVCRGI